MHTMYSNITNNSTLFDLAGIDPRDIFREKSKAATLKERFVRDEFDKVRRLIECTKVFHNEMIIRNSCHIFHCSPPLVADLCAGTKSNNNNNGSSISNNNNNPFQQLPEIILLTIFQYARPENYHAERHAAKREGVGGSPRIYHKQHQRKDFWSTTRKARVFGILEERRELAEACGRSPTDKVLALSRRKKRSIHWISGSVGCHNSQTPPTPSEHEPVRLNVLDSCRFSGIESSDGNNDNRKISPDYHEKDVRTAADLIDSFQRPGWRFSTTLLTPDTHLPGPCFRDFRKYAESHPGWTADRFAATREEREAFCTDNKKKNNRRVVYFVKIFYQTP